MENKVSTPKPLYRRGNFDRGGFLDSSMLSCTCLNSLLDGYRHWHSVPDGTVSHYTEAVMLLGACVKALCVHMCACTLAYYLDFCVFLVKLGRGLFASCAVHDQTPLLESPGDWRGISCMMLCCRHICCCKSHWGISQIRQDLFHYGGPSLNSHSQNIACQQLLKQLEMAFMRSEVGNIWNLELW